jgi:hypothetical protein
MTDKLTKIGSRLINVNNVTYIVDRTIHFNNGDSWTALEPEIQELLAVMFDSPRPEIVEPVVKKTATVAKKVAKKK